MSKTYLETYTFLPLAIGDVEPVLAQPLGALSPSLAGMLDAALHSLRDVPADSLIHHPDADWLDAHIEFGRSLTGWEMLLLQSSAAKKATRETFFTADGFTRRAHGVEYIAFAYWDALLAERLAQVLVDTDETKQFSLFRFAPTGSKDSKDVLLHRGGCREMMQAFPYAQHPLRQSLEARQKSQTEHHIWPAWEAKLRAQPSVLQRWNAFECSQHAKALKRATVAKPLRLGSQHFTDGRAVWFHNADGESTNLEGCDPTSFREVEDFEGFGWYAADAKRLWNLGRPVVCEDPDALEPLAVDDRFMSDGRYVYFDDGLVEGVDARNVRPIPCQVQTLQRGFIHDDEFIFGHGGVFRTTVNAATFRYVGGDYFADKDCVYERVESELLVEESFDPETFAIVEHAHTIYLRDKRHVALVRNAGIKPKPLRGADPRAFQGIKGLPFVADGKRVWLEGQLCKDLDPGTLVLPPLSPKFRTDTGYSISPGEYCYFISAKKVFYVHDGAYRALVGADSKTFELLDPQTARDANHVWVWGDKIHGALGSGFAWVHQSGVRWTDGRDTYDAETKLHKSASNEIVVGVADHGLTREGIKYFFDGVRIEGWSSTTHRVSPIGCIEDDTYLYSLSSVEGGNVFVWTKAYADVPLAYYLRDTSRGCWRLTAPIPPASALETVPRGPLISREEFDTILKCWPTADQYADWSLQFKAPAFDVSIWPFAHSITIKGDVNYVVTWPDGAAAVESIQPIRTPLVCGAIRSALDQILDECPPLSFEELDALVARIPKEFACYSFASDSPAMVEGRFSIIIQDGEQSQRGVWIDALQGGAILRMVVYVADDGLLCPASFTGPLARWEQIDDEGFEPAAWSAKRRGIWRGIIDEVLRDMPVQRAEARKPGGKGRKPLAKTPEWREALASLVDLFSPALTNAQAKQLVARINAGASEAEEGGAWEALMDGLEQNGLLQTFDKQELPDAVARCVALARAVGIEGSYTFSVQAPCKSFFDIAEDFERWLRPQSFCLMWPHGTDRSSGDDYFPVVIVKTPHVDRICALSEKLSDGRGFAQTLA